MLFLKEEIALAFLQNSFHWLRVQTEGQYSTIGLNLGHSSCKLWESLSRLWHLPHIINLRNLFQLWKISLGDFVIQSSTAVDTRFCHRIPHAEGKKSPALSSRVPHPKETRGPWVPPSFYF